ncbi:MAG: RidA family protein [Betaproteobacteria bacterium]|nr:RidA family protein [Betaproteobacteria bacterium]
MMQILQPPDWLPPRGYANGIVATGRQVFISGQIGWNAQCQFETDDFVAQARQALQNVVTVLAEAGGQPQHITFMRWYVVDKREYVGSYKALGATYREVIGKHFPAMTAVQVVALIEDRAKLEIEAVAVIPDAS